MSIARMRFAGYISAYRVIDWKARLVLPVPPLLFQKAYLMFINVFFSYANLDSNLSIYDNVMSFLDFVKSKVDFFWIAPKTPLKVNIGGGSVFVIFQ